MKRFTLKLLAFALGLFLICDVTGQEESTDEKVTFKFGGFAKTDYMYTRYNNGGYSGNGRDFHIPNTIPVGDKDVHHYTDFHVKESRFNFDVSSKINGKKIRTFIELDFMLAQQGNEVVSNSYNPRIRHFFLEYDKLLVGQTWSTFMIVVLPDELDFLGKPDGLIFIRQPMVRYTLGNFQLALENQITTYTNNGGGAGDGGSSQSGLLPDAVGRYNFDISGGKLSLAVIGRHLHYIDGNDDSHSTIGTGATVGGVFDIGSKDDIRFVGTIGTGLGRYAAVAFTTDAVVDNSLNLKPLTSVNGYVAYLHHWNAKFRSSFSGGYMYVLNDSDIIGAANNRSASVSGNILYQPAKNLLFGAESKWGYRELVGGTSGSFVRVQLSARYAFSFKTSVAK